MHQRIVIMDKCEDCTDVPPFYVSYNCHGNGIYHICMFMCVYLYMVSVQHGSEE